MKTHSSSPNIVQNRKTSRKDAAGSTVHGKTEPKAASFANIFARIITHYPVSFLSIDNNGIVTTCLEPDGKSAGIKTQELVGQSIYDLCQHIPEVKILIPELMKEETGRASLHLSDRELDIWHTPLRADLGKKVGVALIVINLTEHWPVEEKLRAEQALLKDMLKFHERDRKLIAYEIHDGLVQDITAAHMTLNSLINCGNLPPGEVQGNLQKAGTLVKKAMEEARQLIRGLRPPILEELGVVSAISLLLEGLPPQGLKIVFTAKVQFERLESLLEASIFRIVQQAINNIQRHSRAERAEIRLTQQGAWIHLEIEDWGIGFDPTYVTEDRFGLQGIRERARLMRGRAVIDSAPGKGTRIIVDLPAAYPLEKRCTRE